MEQTAVLAGRRILVIEDDYLVAEVLMTLLEDAGAVVLGPIGSVDEALCFIAHDSSAFDSVTLDINLHGRVSYPIADALVKRSVRFVFTTGYDAGAVSEAYRGYPRCGKPFDERTLLAVVAPLLD